MSADARVDKPGYGNTVGIVLLVVTFVASLVISVKNTLTVERPTKPVLRIAHWQLEAGYRDAMQAVIDDYAKLHPEIDVIQMPVTEVVYQQWINTQLISGTAPDICEMGQSELLNKDTGTVRYFIPLGAEIAKPNRYNQNTEIANTPWKETMLDGMRGGFRDGLQDFYGVPTTLTSMRLFVNVPLLKRAADYYNSSQQTEQVSAENPKTFGQWMAQCRAIKALADHTGEPLIPVVSCYGLSIIEGIYNTMLTAHIAAAFDLDLDGITNEAETYVAYCKKQFDLNTPQLKAVYTTIRKIGDQMQAGFSGMDRQTAQFRFVNGQAGFLYTGSWDASGTSSQAREKGFQFSVFKVPPLGRNDPNGEFVVGAAGEPLQGAGTYGISKNCKNVPMALDFLQFLTSRAGNEKLNRLAEWPPLTIGARPSDLMLPFTADLRGLNIHLSPSFGSRVSSEVDANLKNFYQGDESYDDFVRAYTRIISDPERGGDWAWWFLYDQRAADERNTERLLAQTQTLDLLDPGSVDQARYHRALLKQILKCNGSDYLYLFKKYRGFDMPMH